MKKHYYSLFLLLLLSLSFVKASHINGYDMTLVSLGNDNYKFRLVAYRDVNAIPYPNQITFQLYNNLNNSPAPVSSVSLNKISSTYSFTEPNTCIPKGTELKIEKIVLESSSINLSSFNSTSGYYASFNTCCRNYGISNLINSSGQDIVFTLDFPRLNSSSPTRNNSSPEFKKSPQSIFYVGKPYSLDWQAIDANGDSLVYHLAQPLGTSNVKPFYLLPYAPGYGMYFNIMDGAPDLTINKYTGMVNFIPTIIGRYAIAVRVEEWRTINSVPTKIGEIRRELQIETVFNEELPPQTLDTLNRSSIIIDTIYADEVYRNRFVASDSKGDTMYMQLLPNIAIGENILNPNVFGATWNDLDSIPLVGVAASNLIIEGDQQITGQFTWKPKCSSIRPNKPYKFTIVVRDQTCPTPFYDSTHVELYVISRQLNHNPIFVLPDTINSTLTKNYFIIAGDTFMLAGDSMLKTFDSDSNQVTSIKYLPNINNGIINSFASFQTDTAVFNASAEFTLQTNCDHARIQPYQFTFYANDNFCGQPNAAELVINLYVLKNQFLKTIYGDQHIILSNPPVTYNYSVALDSSVSYEWKINQNGMIVSKNDSNSITVQWLNEGNNILTCLFKKKNNGCLDSSKINISTLSTGINLEENNTWKVFPNPSIAVVQIEGLPKQIQQLVSIYDIQGKLLFSEIIIEKGIIDLSKMNKGIYIIRIADQYRRIVKM